MMDNSVRLQRKMVSENEFTYSFFFYPIGANKTTNSRQHHAPAGSSYPDPVPWRPPSAVAFHGD
jgi:hypothetical protein